MEGNTHTERDLENFSTYVLSRKVLLGLSNEKLARKLNVSRGEISKIITKRRQSVSIRSFYNIAINSGDTIANAIDYVYPHRNFNLTKLNAYTPDQNLRNKFGSYMKEKFETDSVEYIPSKNSLEIISIKTGIPEKRLKEIYFKSGAPEAYEFLLIEKAVGKKTGEMMKDYIENYLGNI